MPNLATQTEAAAHSFGYMHAGSHHQKVVELVNPSGTWKDLQPIGPSPLIIKIAELERVAPRWLEYSYKLRGDPMPARLIQDCACHTHKERHREPLCTRAPRGAARVPSRSVSLLSAVRMCVRERGRVCRGARDVGLRHRCSVPRHPA